MSKSSQAEFIELGIHACMLRLGKDIDSALNANAHAITAQIRAWNEPLIADVVPAYASVTVSFDLPRLLTTSVLQRKQLLQRLRDLLIAPTSAITEKTSKSILQIPVCFDPEFGLDLVELAQQHKLTVEEWIALYCKSKYSVSLIGFRPGFAYLSGLDKRLHAPRLATPRAKVAAGSVGIAGGQTGIYPDDSPGGWRIIGRTPLTMFDAYKAEPCLCNPGDVLEFTPITRQQFDQLTAANS